MKLLLHSCCGPCTIYPLKVLREKNHSVTSLFYNPNIHPFREFKKRLHCFKIYSESSALSAFLYNSYGLKDFLESCDFSRPERCHDCYTLRLRRTVDFAQSKGFEAFTTTLLYSKYQDHEFLSDLCHDLSVESGLAFVYHDFREGWQYGIDESLKRDMYRQSYCGCIFSEQERYDKKFRKDSRNSPLIHKFNNRIIYAHNARHSNDKQK